MSVSVPIYFRGEESATARTRKPRTANYANWSVRKLTTFRRPAKISRRPQRARCANRLEGEFVLSANPGHDGQSLLLTSSVSFNNGLLFLANSLILISRNNSIPASLRIGPRKIFMRKLLKITLPDRSPHGHGTPSP